MSRSFAVFVFADAPTRDANRRDEPHTIHVAFAALGPGKRSHEHERVGDGWSKLYRHRISLRELDQYGVYSFKYFAYVYGKAQLSAVSSAASTPFAPVHSCLYLLLVVRPTVGSHRYGYVCKKDRKLQVSLYTDTTAINISSRPNLGRSSIWPMVTVGRVSGTRKHYACS
ncbi:hypothetical protein V8C42DRAFT_317301 [Trichoderma barbatum]